MGGGCVAGVGCVEGLVLCMGLGLGAGVEGFDVLSEPGRNDADDFFLRGGAHEAE